MSTPTLLQELREQSQVDCDTLDVEVAKSLGPFVDCTSNQAIALAELQKPQHAQLIKDSVLFAKENLGRYENTSQTELAVETMMVKLSLQIVPYVTGYVHTQTNPGYSYSTSATIAAAERIISIYKSLDPSFDVSRVCIKIPSTWEGLQACRVLETKGISTLATTLFSHTQTVLAGHVGCTYIAPYVNELKVHFEASIDQNKGFNLCHLAQAYYTKHSVKTKVLAASLTSISDVMLLAGVHHITVSPPLLKELNETPGTGMKIAFPKTDTPVGSSRFEDAVRDESRWRMSWTIDNKGEGEMKTIQAITIFMDKQEGLEKIARDCKL